MKDITISIVTVTYNAEKTLRQAMQSVIEQTYPNIEYIIIDGTSTDDTIKIITEQAAIGGVADWVSEPDTGIYQAMNKGIVRATGEYVYILGADDALINRNIIEKIVGVIKNNPTIDVLSAPVWVVEPTGMQFLLTNYCNKTSGEDWASRVISAPHQGMFVKTALMRELLFAESFKVGADYRLLLQLWGDPQINIMKIPDPVAFFSNEGTSSRAQQIRWNEHLQILSELHLQGMGFEKQYEPIIKRIPVWKKIGKEVLKKLSVYQVYLRYRGRKMHQCDWSLCRWCHRL